MIQALKLDELLIQNLVTTFSTYGKIERFLDMVLGMAVYVLQGA
jgi:hypothetical protein